MRDLTQLLLVLLLMILPGCSGGGEGSSEVPADNTAEPASPGESGSKAAAPGQTDADSKPDSVEIDGKPIAALVTALDSKVGSEVSAAARALLSHPEAGVPALCTKCATMDPRMRMLLFMEMASAPETSRAALVDGLRPILADRGKDLRLRMSCVNTIVKCGPAAAAAHAELAGQLHDEKSNSYDFAILQSLKTAGETATASLLKQWPEASTRSRSRILTMLGSLPDTPAVLPILLEAVKGENARGALQLLQARAGADGVAVAVVPCLDDDATRRSAAAVLRAAGEKAREPVLKYLQEKAKAAPDAAKSRGVVEAAGLVAELGEKRALLPLLQLTAAAFEGKGQTRRSARRPSSRDVFLKSIEAIGGPFPGACHEAVRAVVKPRDPAALKLAKVVVAQDDEFSRELLFSLLSDERGYYQDKKLTRGHVETWAADTLGSLEPLPLERLIAALDSDDRLTRWLAARALTKAGPAAKGAVKALLKRLDDHRFIANQAMTALGAMGEAAAEEAAPALVKTIVASAPHEAGKHLGAMGPKAVPAIREGFRTLIKTKKVDGYARRELVSALFVIGPPASKGAMPELALFVNPKQLHKLHGSIPEAVAELVRLVKVNLRSGVQYGVRSQALGRLAAFGPPASSAIPELKRMLKRTKGLPGLRSALQKTIRKIKGH